MIAIDGIDQYGNEIQRDIGNGDFMNHFQVNGKSIQNLDLTESSNQTSEFSKNPWIQNPSTGGIDVRKLIPEAQNNDSKWEANQIHFSMARKRFMMLQILAVKS